MKKNDCKSNGFTEEESSLIEKQFEVLDMESLLKVEGGIDNDEDWCLCGQCESGATKQCYTGA